MSVDPRAVEHAQAIVAATRAKGVTANLEKVERAAERAPERQELIAERARELGAMAVDAPKSARWKARAIVGERVRWFEEPEEPEVEMDTAVR